MRVDVPFHIRVREAWWSYPSYLRRLFSLIGTAIVKFRPYSLLVIISVFVAATGVALAWQYPVIDQMLRVSRNNYLIEAVVSSPVTIDPLPISSTPGAQTQFVRDLNLLIFDPLIRIDKDGSVVPYLASNVTMLDDAKTISVNIRKDIYWQDGEPFTLDDVQFTLDLLRAQGANGIYFAAVDGVTVNVVDSYTLSIQLEKPNPAYLETLMWPVLPKHVLQGVDANKLASNAFATEPIGTGRFVLEGLRENQVLLSRNDEYWGEKPALNGVIFYLFETAEEALKALSAGQVHSFCYYDIADTNFGVDTRVAARYSAPLPKRTMVLYFNLRRTDEPVGDEEFRKALSYATPKAQIIDEVLGGGVDMGYGPIASWSWAFDSSIDYYSFDLNKAAQTLESAGYKLTADGEYRQKDGVEAAISLTYQEDTVRQQIVEKIAEAWRSVGVNVTLVEIPYKMGTGIDRVDNALYEMVLPVRDFDALLFTQETAIDPDLYNQYYSTKVDYPGSNISGYSEVRTDINLEQARTTTVQETRKELYGAVQRRLMLAAPQVYLFTPHVTYFVSNRVSGVDLTGLVFPEDRFNSIENWEV